MEAAVHLFGDTSTPHLWHVQVFHEGDQVTLDWEVRQAPELRWRILRSDEGYAASAEPPGDNEQTLVSETTDTHVGDTTDRHTLYYTLFAQDQTGAWQRQIETKVRPHDRLNWFHPEAGQAVAADGDLLRNPDPLINPSDALTHGPRAFTPLPPQEVGQWVRIEVR